jgi:hypothetical protein
LGREKLMLCPSPMSERKATDYMISLAFSKWQGDISKNRELRCYPLAEEQRNSSTFQSCHQTLT